MTLIGIVALVLALVVSIALHEVGHMVPAKKFGVKVTQYMIGFGPTLWSRTRGDTQYGVKAVLLGGYIRMIGMFPPGSGKASHQGRLGTLIEQAREDSAAEVGPGEEHRTFYNLTVPKKLVVMLGGPVMNLLIAIVLFTVVYAGFGTPTPSTTVDSVTQCVPTASAPDGTCESGGTPTGAASAGLQPGDVIVILAVIADAGERSVVARGAHQLENVQGSCGFSGVLCRANKAQGSHASNPRTVPRPTRPG